MKRIASSTAVAVAPTYSADAGTPGHFGESPNPTHLTAKWCESVNEGLCRTIENAGETLTDSMDQFPNVVNGVHGIKSHATTTGSATTPKKRVAIAVTTSLASGENSLVAANAGSIASGDNSACVAGLTGVSSGLGAFVGGGNTTTASGAGAATIGGASSTASGARATAIGGTTNTVSGDDSAIVGATSSTATAAGASVVGGASHNSTAANTGCFAGNNSDATAAQAVCVGGDGNDATGTNSATVGGSTNVASGIAAGTLGGASNTASGTTSATVGGGSNTASGVNAVTVGGISNTVSGDYAGAIASSGTTVQGNYSLAAGNQGTSKIEGNKSSLVLLASRNGNLFNDGNPSGGGADGYCVAGAYSASASATGSNGDLSWLLSSKHGTLALDNTTLITGADYAEMFPNAEPGELPAGALLARSGGAVRVANPGDRVVGVVSVAPSVLGDAAPLAWSGKHARDEWGRRLYDAEGEPVIADGYDPERPYQARGDRRDQWTAVALVGKVRVRIGPAVKPDDLLAPGPDGCAAPVRPSAREASGRPVEVMEIVSPYDAARGYGIALCLVG